jgi:pantothenate kinase
MPGSGEARPTGDGRTGTWVKGQPPELLEPMLDAVTPILGRARSGDRVLIGITGPPAAGKSTLSTAVAAAVTERYGLPAIAVPMDGFHLANAELERLGLADRKGAPETFDAAGFVHLLRRIRATGPEIVYAPVYSRLLHESIGGAVPIGPEVRVAVIEGNYLLLPDQPWAEIADLLDLVAYVEAPDPMRYGSLVRRQLAKGLDEPQAHAWVNDSDEANARLIATTRARADVVLTRE